MTTDQKSHLYLYYPFTLDACAEIIDARLNGCISPQVIELAPPHFRIAGLLVNELNKTDLAGMILEMPVCKPLYPHLVYCYRVLKSGRAVFFHHPRTGEILPISARKLRRLWMSWLRNKFGVLLPFSTPAAGRAGGGLAYSSTPLDHAYLYVYPTLDSCTTIYDERLEDCTERHKLRLKPDNCRAIANFEYEFGVSGARGVILEMSAGWPGFYHLRLLRLALAAGLRTFLYWPGEHALECVDDLGWRNLTRLWSFCFAAWKLEYPRRILKLVFSPHSLSGFYRIGRELLNGNWTNIASILRAWADILDLPQVEKLRLDEARALLKRAAPLPWRVGAEPVGLAVGKGVYLRMDFWAKIDSGGSYGHTCYVVKELARASQSFCAFMGHRYLMIDAMGVIQVDIPYPTQDQGEGPLLPANNFYFDRVRPALVHFRPDFIYERVVLGNTVGAALSQELSIPYIVEYNGSEIMMKRSFDDGGGYRFEQLYLLCEQVAFAQATAINVVSEMVKQDLAARGVDPNKILVNPNGVDPDVFAPLDPEAKSRLRAELGFSGADVVICFTGTFGGWHGIDILAQSLPLICAREPRAKFLLIGDGNFKHLIADAVKNHGLEDRVKDMGRVPQAEGARLLGAADIFVSPHNVHMKGSRFFGSPTKIFEYMAMAGGIVASDLEQIGQVLSPALRADALGPEVRVTDQRSVLCVPGDLDQFVSGVLFLAANPDVRSALGENARKAVLEEFSWQRHVDRILRFAAGRPAAAVPALAPLPEPEPKDADEADEAEKLATGDTYKDEAQNQWNRDPCGSHYVKDTPDHVLEWFKAAEDYRYGTYAPWMPELMEFSGHGGEKVLEIGGGMGTDLARFAASGAIVTDLDLSAGHLALARKNFDLRGLNGTFIHHDAETLPFDDASFDLVYSNGVLHHIPNTGKVVDEIWRVLRPGGKAIVMFYALNSLNYWINLVYREGIRTDLMLSCSMGEIMSRTVEISEHGQKPLVKVYTKPMLRRMFSRFTDVRIHQRQMVREELGRLARIIPLDLAGRLWGWNLIVKAVRPGR